MKEDGNRGQTSKAELTDQKFNEKNRNNFDNPIEFKQLEKKILTRKESGTNKAKPNKKMNLTRSRLFLALSGYN